MGPRNGHIHLRLMLIARTCLAIASLRANCVTATDFSRSLWMGHGWEAVKAFSLSVLRQVTMATLLQEVLLALLLDISLF